MLECGHPDACWNADDEDDKRCEWCEEVGNLQQQLKGMREQLHKQAVIVTGGSPTIEGDIGYLLMVGGTLHHVDKGYTRPNWPHSDFFSDAKPITRMQP